MRVDCGAHDRLKLNAFPFHLQITFSDYDVRNYGTNFAINLNNAAKNIQVTRNNDFHVAPAKRSAVRKYDSKTNKKKHKRISRWLNWRHEIRYI